MRPGGRYQNPPGVSYLSALDDEESLDEGRKSLRRAIAAGESRAVAELPVRKRDAVVVAIASLMRSNDLEKTAGSKTLYLSE